MPIGYPKKIVKGVMILNDPLIRKPERLEKSQNSCEPETTENIGGMVLSRCPHCASVADYFIKLQGGVICCNICGKPDFLKLFDTSDNADKSEGGIKPDV